MRTVAFIPARQTSRRFPGKNLALLAGVSLLARSVEVALAAKALGVVTDVVVSVEEYSMALAADKAGATAFYRSPEARNADATVLDVTRDFLETNQGCDLVCLLLPTSPLRTPKHIVESRLLLSETADAVMSVTPFRQDVDYALHVTTDGVVMRHNERGCQYGERWEGHRYWKHDGSVLWSRASWLTTAKNLYDGRIVPYMIPAEESCDVNTPLDLEWAAFLRRGSRSHD